MSKLNRRDFIKTAAAGSAALALPHMLTSCDTAASAGNKIKIGCFALVKPFTPMQAQFEAIKEMGIKYADVTDNHEGGKLGVEYDFAASISLDSHPEKIRKMIGNTGIKLATFCAHANLLDPASPNIYGTSQIIKAIRLAKLLGIKDVITTEGHFKTDFARKLTPKERLLTIKEKLQSPIQWAEDLGVELLLEPHGIVTDNVQTMGDLLTELGHEKTVGICLDTGNSWVGGAEPVDYVTTFGKRIKHIHWKDMGKEWLPKRGKVYGTGMATIPLGTGEVNIQAVVDALKQIGYHGTTTMEIAGADNIKQSIVKLKEWGLTT
jgi:inosose dehydratase